MSLAFSVILTLALCWVLWTRKGKGDLDPELSGAPGCGADNAGRNDGIRRCIPGALGPCQLILRPCPTMGAEARGEERRDGVGWPSLGVGHLVRSTPPRLAGRPLWSPWGHSNTLWTQEPHLTPFLLVTVDQSGWQGGFHFLAERLSLQQYPSSNSSCCPPVLPPVMGWGWPLTSTTPALLCSCPLMSNPGQQAVCLCCQACFRMGLYFGFCFSLFSEKEMASTSWGFPSN